MNIDMHEPPAYPSGSLEWSEGCRCYCHTCCVPRDAACDDCEEDHGYESSTAQA
jgi:hypothetical protein